VLYFYPKDNTPGCTTESIAFRELHDQFAAAGTEIYGISRDSLRSHEGFKSKLGLPFELISDPDEAVCQQFGVMKMKNMYGKQVRGVERSTFIIDADGRLVKEWRGVKVADHADEVLEFVKSQP
jgi:peroxiredoxin Q/BCP